MEELLRMEGTGWIGLNVDETVSEDEVSDPKREVREIKGRMNRERS